MTLVSHLFDGYFWFSGWWRIFVARRTRSWNDDRGGLCSTCARLSFNGKVHTALFHNVFLICYNFNVSPTAVSFWTVCLLPQYEGSRSHFQLPSGQQLKSSCTSAREICGMSPKFLNVPSQATFQRYMMDYHFWGPVICHVHRCLSLFFV